MRRHLLALLLALAMALTLTACGGSDGGDKQADPGPEAAEEVSEEAEADQAEETEPEQGPAEEAPAEETPAEPAGWAPTMPVTVIVNSEANQGSDATARLLCQYAERFIGQSVYFENMVGETGTQGWEEIAHREPDGLSLGVVELPQFNQFLRDRKPDFTLRRYTAVCSYVSDCAAIVVRANDSRFNSIEDIVNYAHVHQGELVVPVDGERGPMHIAAQAFAKSAVFTYAPSFYGTAGEAIQAVRDGTGDFCAVEVGDILGREDDLEVLAVFSENRIGAYPDVPTLGELGYYDQWLGSATCIVAPYGTPDEILAFYENAFNSVLNDPGFAGAAAGTISTEFRSAADAGTLIRRQQQFLESMTEDFWTIVLPEPESTEETPTEGW